MIYEFICINCDTGFEELAIYDETEKYPTVVCPQCGSLNKKKVPSMFAFNFGNPEGTKKWDSHDYRYKTKAPGVQAERALAEAASHMGVNPYKNKNDIDKYDTGIYDAK